MSFTIQTMVNNSERNRLNKDVSVVETLTGNLRENTSIVNPVITVITSMGDIRNCNYMYISAFNRYYYITDIRSIRNGVVEISGHCDVLMSFKDGLLTNSAIIRRQENYWNLYLNDGSFKIYQNPNVLTKEFPSGFSAMEFVLAVAGD